MEPLGKALLDAAKAALERGASETEHQASCAEAPCVRCKRWLCRACKKPFDKNVQIIWPEDRPSVCDPCRDAHYRRKWFRDAHASIPVAFAEASLASAFLAPLVGSQAMHDAKCWLSEPRVAFVGPPGAGKTSLAVAMLRAVTERDLSEGRTSQRYLYVSAHKLAKARVGHPLGQGEAPMVQQALTADLLVIDELGGEDSRHASAVGEVIYERHAECVPTWVTTGATPEKLAERYGGGIARRLFEDAKVFNLIGRRR